MINLFQTNGKRTTTSICMESFFRRWESDNKNYCSYRLHKLVTLSVSQKDRSLMYHLYLRIDCNFCSVHEEITSIRLYIPRNVTQWCVQPDWGYFEWTEQIISINPYKLIQTFFVMILREKYIYFFKIRQIIGIKFK
jgi:hypothetical protein